MQPVRMMYQEYILNLIDTPGHADFSYEVSRSLAAVEGVILLVDATKGVQAQTLAHLHHAQEQDLVIVPAVNKIDSPLARTEEVVQEIASLLQIEESEILRVSAKEGTRVQELLDMVIQKVPAPHQETAKPLRALIFDSVYDSFRGIIAYVRVVEGTVQAGAKISFCGTNAQTQVKEVGYFLPQQVVGSFLCAGDIGYVATGLKDPKEVRIGDTVIKSQSSNLKSQNLALPGFQVPKPMVFASFYPQDVDDFDILKTALSQLQLNDPSFVFEQEAKEALGRGFRCGFLGVLHSEIIAERVQREFHIEMVVSRPSVEFHIIDKAGKELHVRTPADWPNANTIGEIQEPICKLDVISPVESLSSITLLLLQREGVQLSVTDLAPNRLLLSYRIPLREIVGDLHDQLKSASKGLASMDYEVTELQKADVVKLEIHVAGKNEEALSVIVPRHRAYQEGKTLLAKLKDSLPAQQFEVALQAFEEGRVIARETIKAQRRDVTAPLYGGDVTRKRKLLEIQKKGKKELKAKGRVVIPTRVFLDLFRS
jgi:GTP-binding protein LepA